MGDSIVAYVHPCADWVLQGGECVEYDGKPMIALYKITHLIAYNYWSNTEISDYQQLPIGITIHSGYL